MTRGDSSPREEASPGDLYARQCAAARVGIDRLRRENPGIEDEKIVKLLKQRAVRDLTGVSVRGDGDGDGDGQTLRSVVSKLAVEIALVRGLELNTDGDFEELSRRVITTAEKTGALHRKIGEAVPRASSAAEVLIRRVQPYVAELLFNTMSGAKPSTAGVRRDAYKKTRSAVWHARHDRAVSAAATHGAAAAFLRAVDAAAPRIIVRTVDRSLRVSTVDDSQSPPD